MMSDTENIELVALFDFERLNSENYPENERYGEGSIRIGVDKVPETAEDFTEIAKAIFKNGGYAQVAVKSVFFDDDGLFSALKSPDKVDNSYVIDQAGEAGILDEDEVVIGEVVDD
jgi:hypothetical protein